MFFGLAGSHWENWSQLLLYTKNFWIAIRFTPFLSDKCSIELWFLKFTFYVLCVASLKKRLLSARWYKNKFGCKAIDWKLLKYGQFFPFFCHFWNLKCRLRKNDLSDRRRLRGGSFENLVFQKGYVDWK